MSKSVASTKKAPKNSLAGYGKYLRFTLKHNIVRYLVWIGIIVFLVAYVSQFYKTLFVKKEELDAFISTVGLPSMVAMIGTVSSVAVKSAALCAAVWAKIWMFSALTLGIGMVFQVTKGVRADEENGRTELFRSRPFGIHSTLASVVTGALLLCAVAGLLSTLSLIALNMNPANGDITGAVVFGMSLTAVGWLGVGVGALTNQLSASSSIANSSGSIIIMAFYCMRMIGDLGSNDTLTWLSPIGWAEKMAPWGENRIWLMIPNIILTILFIFVAFVIEARRDYGSGVLKDKTGRPDAKPYMKRSWGLVLRLYKGSIISWSIAIVISGLMFGSVVSSMKDMLKNANVPFLDASSMNAMAGFMLMFIGLISVILPMLIMTGLRSDETKGLIETQLAGSISRSRMVLERFAIGTVATAFLLILGGASFGLSYGSVINDMSQIWRMAIAALIYLPGIMAIVGVVVLLFGLAPRATIPVTWFVYGLMYFAVLLLDTLKLPDKVAYIFPFNGTPKVPGEAFSPIVFAYLAAAIVFVVIGIFGLQKRDVPR